MPVNGIIRPTKGKVTHAGSVQIRYRMAYQEPRFDPVPLCGIQIPDSLNGKPIPLVCRAEAHVTSLQARQCATAKEWSRRLELYGYATLEVLRELNRVAVEQKAARKAAREAQK